MPPRGKRLRKRLQLFTVRKTPSSVRPVPRASSRARDGGMGKPGLSLREVERQWEIARTVRGLESRGVIPIKIWQQEWQSLCLVKAAAKECPKIRPVKATMEEQQKFHPARTLPRGQERLLPIREAA